MQENLRLLLLYLAICMVILVRVAVEENGFTTPDSIHYMAAAESINKKGSFIYEVNGNTLFLSLWPSGYPISIALIQGLTSLSFLWSSKLVNLLWLGWAFWLIRKQCQTAPSFVALIFCSNSLLEVFSYTWTEGGFIVCLFWASLAAYNLWGSDSFKPLAVLEVVFAALILFLHRYVGGFFLLLLGLGAGISLWRKKYSSFSGFSMASIFISTGIAGYFWFISQVTGHYSGATRISPDETFPVLVASLMKAQVNEIALIRKINFNSIDFTALAFMGVQLLLVLLAFTKLRRLENWRKFLSSRSSDKLSLFIFITGVTYWAILITLRFFIMKFDLFDFRLLAPSSALILLSLHLYLAAEHRAPLLAKIKAPITTIYLLALAHGLYKRNLIDTILTHTNSLF